MIKQSFTLRDIEHITGINSNTLRMWKKRYGILKPWKVIAGRMHYTINDLKYIQHVKTLLDGGMRISDVVSLSRDELLKQVRALSLSGKISLPYTLDQELTKAVITLDDHKLDEIYRKTLEHYSFKGAMTKVLFPFLKKIGMLWENEAIHTVQEHFYSNFIRTKLLVAIDYLPEVRGDIEFVLFLPDLEIHELPLLLTNYLLLESGHRTFYLGSSVPYEEMDFIFERYDIPNIVTGWTYTGEVEWHLEKMTTMIEEYSSTRFFLHQPAPFSKSFEKAFDETKFPNLKIFKDLDQLEEMINPILSEQD